MKIFSIIALLSFSLTALAAGEVQQSAPFGFTRRIEALRAASNGLDSQYTEDLMFITKGTTTSGKSYAFYTFGDTLNSSLRLFGNTLGWSDDFDLSDGTRFNFKESPPTALAQGMTPMSKLPHDPSAPDATEVQIWYGHSFVMGQDIYTYYISFGPNHKGLGVGMAVLRGGLQDSDFSNNHMNEFERIPKSKFWVAPYFFDGAPFIKTESDGKTYLYLFNQFGVQRTLFTPGGVENYANYKTWDGNNWVTGGFAKKMWDGELAIRASVDWNSYLNKYVAVYTPWDSGDGRNSQLTYRTADNITGPWSEKTVLLYGTSLANGGNEKAGDYYNPIYRSFFDRDGGKSIYVMASSSGSSGDINIFEHQFDHQVQTTNLYSIPQFSPQGLDEIVNVNHDGVSAFFFRESSRVDPLGNVRRTYPNGFLYTRNDFDTSDGLSFHRNLGFRVLRPYSSTESLAWILTAFAVPSSTVNNKMIGAFYKTFDKEGRDLGTGFAYTPTKNVVHFKRTKGFLPESALISKIVGVVPLMNTVVILNDELDSAGNVYLAKAETGSVYSGPDVGAVLTSPGSYSYATTTINEKGFEARSWSKDPADAKPIFDNALKPSIFRSSYKGGYIAIYTVKNSAWGENSQVAMRTAQTFNGPWSEPVVLYSVQNTSGSKGRLYNAKYLSGYDKEGGKVIHFYATDHDTKTVNLYQVRL